MRHVGDRKRKKKFLALTYFMYEQRIITEYREMFWKCNDPTEACVPDMRPFAFGLKGQIRDLATRMQHKEVHARFPGLTGSVLRTR